ncbi:hypothetical protein FOA52_009173, partial [Chlamydomonas sp. UWO 241]
MPARDTKQEEETDTAWQRYKQNFSNDPDRDAILYLALVFVFLAYALVALFADLIVAHLLPECTLAPDTREFQNVLYDSNPCLEVRYPGLLFITRREAEQLRRVLCSIVLGSIIGYERR